MGVETCLTTRLKQLGGPKAGRQGTGLKQHVTIVGKRGSNRVLHGQVYVQVPGNLNGAFMPQSFTAEFVNLQVVRLVRHGRRRNGMVTNVSHAITNTCAHSPTISFFATAMTADVMHW